MREAFMQSYFHTRQLNFIRLATLSLVVILIVFATTVVQNMSNLKLESFNEWYYQTTSHYWTYMSLIHFSCFYI